MRTDHQKLERKVNVMGNRINKLSNETDRTQAFMLEFAEFSGMTNARAVMAKCGKQDRSKEDGAKNPTPTDAEEDDMEVDKHRKTGKRLSGEKSVESTCDATTQHAWAVVKLGNRHHVMHVEHVRTEHRAARRTTWSSMRMRRHPWNIGFEPRTCSIPSRTPKRPLKSGRQNAKWSKQDNSAGQPQHTWCLAHRRWCPAHREEATELRHAKNLMPHRYITYQIIRVLMTMPPL